MPILPLEPYVSPEDLFALPAAAPETPSRWWVLHTRPRTEKSLARRMLRGGLPFFLPLYERTLPSRGRLLQVYKPLFPSYVFLFGDASARLEALGTRLVVQSLAVSDQARLYDDLSRVYRLMTSGVPLTPFDSFAPGTLVRIGSGPLEGLTAKVLRRGKRPKIIVEVEFLRRGVSAEVEEWMLEKV